MHYVVIFHPVYYIGNKNDITEIRDFVYGLCHLQRENDI